MRQLTTSIHQQPLKLGILGGGQLGRMLLPPAMQLPLEVSILDPDPQCSAAQWCSRFVQGDFRDYQTVYQFGRTLDVLTIEIEQVNITALFDLEREGVAVFPQPTALQIIQDKGLQKQHYAHYKLPTSPFYLFDTADQVCQAVVSGKINLPFVQKTRQLGYDGKGVLIVRTPSQLYELFDMPCVVEYFIPLQKELAVLVACDAEGQIAVFPPVEMVFHPTANLVEMLQCPADLSPNLAARVEALAIDTLKSFGLRGILAVEMFLDFDNQLYINEVAPRPHNCGHFTIEACETSQYAQHLRAISGFPLGSTRLYTPAVMLNILGGEGQYGRPQYEGLNDCLALSGVHLHLYGKAETRPFRKMGHITITDAHLEHALEKATYIQQRLKVNAFS